MQKLFAFNYYSNLDCIKTRVINRAHIYEQQLTVFAERLIRNAIKSLGQSTRQSQLCSYRRSLQSRVICSSCGCSSHSFRIPPVLFIQLTLGPKLPAAPPSANHREQGFCLLVWAGAQIEFCSADIRKRPQRTEFGIIKGVPPSLALITPPLVWMAQPPPPGKEGRGEEGVHVMPTP